MVANVGYVPRKPETIAWLKEGWDAVQNAPYKVSTRWLFYVLLQKGFFKKKNDYKNQFIPVMSKVRHGEYKDWLPDTIADESRTPIYQGYGATDEDDVCYTAFRPLDKFKDQKNIVFVAYEANAMTAQFKKYISYQPLFPCGGQPSIPYKYQISQCFEERYREFEEDDKNLVLLYFGDCDEAGGIIRDAIFEHVQKWCSYPIKMVYCGLSLDQAQSMNLYENPDKKGTYQWESLTDTQAKEIIESYLYRYIDVDILNSVIKRDREIKQEYKDKEEE